MLFVLEVSRGSPFHARYVHVCTAKVLPPKLQLTYPNDSELMDPDKTETLRSISGFWCYFSPLFPVCHWELW